MQAYYSVSSLRKTEINTPLHTFQNLFIIRGDVSIIYYKLLNVNTPYGLKHFDYSFWLVVFYKGLVNLVRAAIMGLQETFKF